MNPRIIPAAGVVALCIAVVPVLERLSSPATPLRFDVTTVVDDTAAAIYREHTLDAGGEPYAHSAALARLANGDVRAFWYGGSREGGKDVAVYTARYSASASRWSPARRLFDRRQVAAQLNRHIKKLGNPAAVTDAGGRLWLFFVSVSVGGWSGSAINYAVSDDGGETYSPVKRLTTSPFFNVSSLVRASPALRQHDRGGIALPIYHEFIGKFAEVLELDADGAVRDKHRLTWGRGALQPSLTATSPTAASVFMRNANKDKVLFTATTDGGATFARPTKTNLPNPNSAVAALTVSVGGDGDGDAADGDDNGDGNGDDGDAADDGDDNGDDGDAADADDKRILLVYNPTTRDREILSLAVMDGATGVRVHDFENARGKQFSYPALIEDARGLFHLAYSYDVRRIKHIVFNRAWLAQQTRR